MLVLVGGATAGRIPGTGNDDIPYAGCRFERVFLFLYEHNLSLWVRSVVTIIMSDVVASISSD